MADDTGFQSGKDSFTTKTPPSAAYVGWLLSQGDVQSQSSPLHRLGTESYNASPGHHRHDGRTSAFLFNKNDTILGDISTTAGQRTAIKKIIGLLVQLGASDGTTG